MSEPSPVAQMLSALLGGPRVTEEDAWWDDTITIDPDTGVATIERRDKVTLIAHPDHGAVTLSGGYWLSIVSLDEGWTVDITEPPDGDYVHQLDYVPFPT